MTEITLAPGSGIGWRGYALPRLADRMGPALASVLLGVIWAAWHLRFFYILGGDTLVQSFPLFLLQLIALSVAMAWLYFRTSGSLLLVMLMHAAVNNTKDIVPSAGAAVSNPMTFSGTLVFRLTVAVMWVGRGGPWSPWAGEGSGGRRADLAATRHIARTT